MIRRICVGILAVGFEAPPLAFALGQGGPKGRTLRTAFLHSRTTPRALYMSIEIERKYSVVGSPATLRTNLAAAGATLEKELSFEDAYFDTGQLTLTKRDVWLRQRAGSWELKVPLDGARVRSGGETAAFREIEGEAAVEAELNGLNFIKSAVGDTLSGRLGVSPFARFTTVRSRWALGGCSIDVDTADFGIPPVVEIERMCASKADVPEAYAAIDATADGLIERCVLAPLTSSQGGKLESYIRLNCPAHLAALVEAGLLSPSPGQ